MSHAKKADKYQIMHFQSDTLFYNHATQVTLYQGHIKLTQGTRIFLADRAFSYTNKVGQVFKIVAMGHPASYSVLISPHKPKLIATGNTIYYYPLQELVEAIGDAELIQGLNRFKGPRITYDFNAKTVASPLSTKGRTQILLAPLKSMHS